MAYYTAYFLVKDRHGSLTRHSRAFSSSDDVSATDGALSLMANVLGEPEDESWPMKAFLDRIERSNGKVGQVDLTKLPRFYPLQQHPLDDSRKVPYVSSGCLVN